MVGVKILSEAGLLSFQLSEVMPAIEAFLLVSVIFVSAVFLKYKIFK